MSQGGKREGAGRKAKGNKLITASFRVDPDAYAKAQELHGKELSQKVNAFIKRLSKPKKEK
jgi:hypothetical protein